MKKKICLLILLCGLITVCAAGCSGSDNAHKLTEIEATVATCTENGYDAHFKCSHCDRLFSDAKAKQPITIESITHTKLGHEPIHKTAKAATCTEAGYIDHYGCTRCDAVFTDVTGSELADDSPILPAIEHNGFMTFERATAPTPNTEGNVAHYHCSNCQKNFNNIYGDTEIANVKIPQIVLVQNVSVRVMGYKDGKEETLQGDITFQNAFGDTIRKNVADNSVAFDSVYATQYTVNCGEYNGKITFETGKTSYDLRLEYRYATSTGVSSTGMSEADFSRMNDENHTITLSDGWGNTTANYTEAKINLPENITNSKNVTVSFTLKHAGAINYMARFGVKMTDTDGMFISAFSDREMQVCVLYRDKANDIFDGWDDANNRYATEFASALIGETGLRVRMIRLNDYIRMFIQVDSEWVELVNWKGVATCDKEKPTDIRLLILSHTWEFSDIEYGILTHEEAQTGEQNKQFEHYTYTHNGEKFFWNTDGTLTTEDAVKLVKLNTVDLILKNTDGQPVSSGLQIALSQSELDQTINTTVGSNGTVTLSGNNAVYKAMQYTVQLENYGKFYLLFEDAQTEYTIYATDTSKSDTGNSSVRLIKNGTQNTVVLADAVTHNGTNDYTQATLSLPSAIKNSQNALAYFTLKYRGNGFNPYARFGVKMAGEDGMFVTVNGDIQVCVFGRDKQNDTFDGWDNANTGYSAKVISALQGNGLPVMFVRIGANIRMFAKIGAEWIELKNYQGVATCAANASTNIRLLILGHEWEFANIGYETLQHVSQQAATIDTNGKKEHYVSSEFEFTTAGLLGTESNLVIPRTDKLQNVQINVKGKKDGSEHLLSGAISLSGNYDDIASMTGNAVEGNVSLSEVYTLTYQIVCGDYFGTITFEKGQTVYEVVLEYRYAENTGDSITGNSAIDFSEMNGESHTLILKDSNVLDTTNYTEAKLNLPQDVRESRSVIASFTLRYFGNEFNAYSRFGVKMAGNRGVFVSVFGSGRLEVCPFYRGLPNNIFDGYDDLNYDFAEYVTMALKSNAGLQAKAVRIGTNIRMFVYLENEWWELLGKSGVATCQLSDETDIRLLVLGHEWEFSDIEYRLLEEQPSVPATKEHDGTLAYYTAQDLYFHTDGTLAERKDLIVPQLKAMENITVIVTGYKDGTVVDISGEIKFTPQNELKDETVQMQVANRTLTLNGVYALSYDVICGDYFGEVTFKSGATEYNVQLQYKYATNTSGSSTGNSVIDFSRMNDGNHTIIMKDTYDNTIGTKNYTEAKLNLTDEVSNASNVCVSFTVKHSGAVGPTARFGVKLTENAGLFITESGEIQVCVFYRDKQDDIFDGWDDANKQYSQNVINALQGDDGGNGLEVRMVRIGTQIRMFVKIDSEWVELVNYKGIATCQQNDKTDIRLLILSDEWQFSQIEYGIMQQTDQGYQFGDFMVKNS